MPIFIPVNPCSSVANRMFCHFFLCALWRLLIRRSRVLRREGRFIEGHDAEPGHDLLDARQQPAVIVAGQLLRSARSVRRSKASKSNVPSSTPERTRTA